MTELMAKINALIDASDSDIQTIENTLTDGYAFALSLERERWRLERRMSAVAASLREGDAVEKAAELSSVAQRLEGNAGELSHLRGLLAELRRHADEIRVAAVM